MLVQLGLPNICNVSDGSHKHYAKPSQNVLQTVDATKWYMYKICSKPTQGACLWGSGPHKRGPVNTDRYRGHTYMKVVAYTFDVHVDSEQGRDSSPIP